MNLVLVIQIILGVCLVFFTIIWLKDLIKNKNKLNDGNLLLAGVIGFVTNFFDTLGIGSYAPTTMLLKLTKYMKNDKLLPGTLTIACSIPVLTEAFLYINTVKVEAATLLSLIVAASVGSFLGSKFISRIDEKKIQVMMGFALIITAILMCLSNTGVLASLGNGNVAVGLTGWKLFIGILGNFILGALMTAGIGLYAPCMAMVYLLGLSPLVAFPLMMASCAVLMPVASREFIKDGNYNRNATIGITIGGILGVFVAVTLVKSMSLTLLTWLVIIVLIYTAITMLMQGFKKEA